MSWIRVKKSVPSSVSSMPLLLRSKIEMCSSVSASLIARDRVDWETNSALAASE